MFGPKRKIGEKTFKEVDPPVTQEKLDSYKRDLDYLERVVRPKLSKEVMILAEGGDFSENAGYQAAKGKLRGINSRITELKERIARAQVITKPLDSSFVELGHTITFTLNGKQHTYTLLGSSETNPSKGIISHNSPLGKALLGRMNGENFKTIINNKSASIAILKVE